MLAAAASVLLILTVAIFSITNNKSINEFIEMPSNAAEDSLSIVPDTLYPDSLIIDSLDLQ
jgi:hypothetical protein